ncbi:MAG: L,D-transpeptidase family protein [Firmicutes bacterium]|nr:L,D-transpeptidase family protein [Bacillota bacterium]
MQAMSSSRICIFSHTLVCLTIVIMVALGFSAIGYTSSNTDFELDALIKDTVIYANITQDTPAYNDYSSGRTRIGEFRGGEIVEIVRDRAFEWYLVRSEDGREGWVSVNCLWIPEDPETNLTELPRELLETYVNERNLTSKTDHLVWVDIDRQLTHVFTGGEGNWTLIRTMFCSTGKNVSPTLRGLHEVAERGEWFFTERLNRGGENWVQFAGPYMFHSLPMDRDRNIMDYTLRERRSSGCIRLSMEDSVWFYSFIKRRSTVFVN